MDYQQEPSGSSYRPNMDVLHDSQPYQEYSPIRSGNLEMNLEDWGEYPSQQYSTQNPIQDASMGQASGHGSYHGSMPVEDDYEDYVEEASPIKPKKPTKRATKAKGKAPEAWSKAEELALCRAFIFVSENDKRGNAMHRHNFWELVIDYFRRETGLDRTYNSIVSKWKTRIRAPVANFCAIMDNIKLTHGSGENDEDDKDKALREYRIRNGVEFNLLECWKLLRHHTTWKKELPLFTSGSRKKSKGSTTTSGSTQGPQNFQDLGDDDDDDEGETRESRRQGRDAARKKSSSSSSRGGPDRSWASSLLPDFWKTKPSKSSKQDKAKEREETWKAMKEQELATKKAIKEQELAIKQEKMELQRKQVQLQESQVQIMNMTKTEQDLIFYNSKIDPTLPERQQNETYAD